MRVYFNVFEMAMTLTHLDTILTKSKQIKSTTNKIHMVFKFTCKIVNKNNEIKRHGLIVI